MIIAFYNYKCIVFRGIGTGTRKIGSQSKYVRLLEHIFINLNNLKQNRNIFQKKLQIFSIFLSTYRLHKITKKIIAK